jgi:hypothetical protein
MAENRIRSFGTVSGIAQSVAGLDVGTTPVDADLIPANILAGVTILGVVGTAKRMASGTGVTGTGGVISVTGLPFRPAVILLEEYVNGTQWYRGTYDVDQGGTLNSYWYNTGTAALYSATLTPTASGFTATFANYVGSAYLYKCYEA